MLNHLHDKLLVSRQTELQDAKVDRGSQVVRVGDEAELPGDHHHQDDGGHGDHRHHDGYDGGHGDDEDDGCPCLT